jgi:hypothetical protein
MALGLDRSDDAMIWPMIDRSIAEADALPWLLDLATRQPSTDADPGSPTYDEAAQMTYLHQPVRVLAIDSDARIGTKKADRETGEDQKGF